MQGRPNEWKKKDKKMLSAVKEALKQEASIWKNTTKFKVNYRTVARYVSKMKGKFSTSMAYMTLEDLDTGYKIIHKLTLKLENEKEFVLHANIVWFFSD